MSRISIADLKVGQIESIEKELGVPMHRWDSDASLITVYVKMLAAYHGDGEDKYRAMTIRELTSMVELDEAPDSNP